MQSLKKKSPVTILLFLSVILVFVICVDLIVFYFIADRFTKPTLTQVSGDPTRVVKRQNTKTLADPTNQVNPGTPQPSPQPTISPANVDAANETWQTLNDALIPEADPVELAESLGGKQNVPETFIDEDAPYALGASKAFWVMDTDTTKVSSINAKLSYVGDHIYIWIQDGVNYRENSLKRLGDTIDTEIVPTNRAFFGSEWNPGVDGDERFYILYARKIGTWVAGYYSSADEVHPEAHPYSNAHEMFLLSADNVQLDDSYILGTIAHEYQHMIHWNLDKNEEAWVNEGFSMLAEQVNGYDAGGFDWNYMQNTDLQLNDWSGGDEDNSAHYGASYLFMSYYLDRFGENATKALVAHKENGFIAMDAVAEELQLINPDTNKPYTGIEIFGDWAAANLLRRTGIANQRYDYKSYYPYTLKITETLHACPESIQRDVNQFGVDYIELQCDNINNLMFEGEKYVKVLPIDDIPSGEYFWWSNAGDESNMRLERDFDLSQVEGEAILKFMAWYEIEEDYDYAYLSASTDGEYWSILETSTCTKDNPSGNSYGCGWTHKSNGWIQEEVDLSAYVGKTVTLRFDYVTDAAVNLHGLALDDFCLDAINYVDDLENGGGGWQGKGFVRIQNILPQKYVVSVVRYGAETSVEHYYVNGDEKLTITLDKSPSAERVVIIVSGATIGTRQKTDYQVYFGN